MDLLSSILMTLQSSMKQFISVASHLITATRITDSPSIGESQLTPLTLPPFLPHPKTSIPVAPPLNPLPPFPPTGVSSAPTYSYIVQQAPSPKPHTVALSHQPPPPQKLAKVRVRDIQSHRSRGRPACFWCGDTDHLTSYWMISVQF
jgi:hypothetical protein